jgi:anti-anti-sigma regulatory factor
MLTVETETLGDLTVVECEGRIVRSAAVFKLRDAVMSQAAARIIVLDLSEVEVIGGGGVGMLVFLQQWACNHDIRLKLYSPSRSVVDGLERHDAIRSFETPNLHEMMTLLANADSRYALAAGLIWPSV